MDIRVFPSTFHGTVSLIGSKSLSHRYLIGAALGNQESLIHGLMDADDIDATKNILKALGAEIDLPKIKGPLQATGPQTLNAGASGSTLRFLIPIALLMDTPFIFEGTRRLPQRTLQAYEDCFRDHDVVFERLSDHYLPLKVQGPLKPGIFHLAADISSQFVSGLLFALPFLNGDSVIQLKTKIASKPYFEMTLNVLKEFGLSFEETETMIKVPGLQTIKPLSKTIEGDYSQALFFGAGAILGGDLKLLGLTPSSMQGDAQVFSNLKTMGIDFHREKDTLQISSQSFHHLDMDLEKTPDAAPMLMLMSAFGQSPSSFQSLHRLKEKESDRYQAICQTFDQMHIPYQGNHDETIVWPKPTFQSNQPFKTFDDHRMAMALLMCAPKAAAPYLLKGVECIDKSYPNFLEIYKDIGGKFEVLGDQR